MSHASTGNPLTSATVTRQPRDGATMLLDETAVRTRVRR